MEPRPPLLQVPPRNVLAGLSASWAVLILISAVLPTLLYRCEARMDAGWIIFPMYAVAAFGTLLILFRDRRCDGD